MNITPIINKKYISYIKQIICEKVPNASVSKLFALYNFMCYFKPVHSSTPPPPCGSYIPGESTIGVYVALNIEEWKSGHI